MFYFACQQARALPAGIDDQVRCLPVKRVPLCIQIAQATLRIGRAQQRAIDVISRALPEVARLCIQIHHASCSAHHHTAFRIQHRTAARGDHYLAAATQFRNHLRLAGTEAGLTLNFEDHRHFDAGARLDLMVGVMKWPLECARQQATDSGLACTHKAHENDVIGHDYSIARRILSAALRAKKSRAQARLFST